MLKLGACCDCGGDGACAVECRSKAGSAELCGFAEFTDPSSPPKKYRKREIEGTMNLQEYLNEDCGDPDCPGELSVNWAGNISLSPFDYTAQLSVVLLGISGGIATYQISGLVGDSPNDSGSTHPLTGSHVRAGYPNGGGGFSYIGPGASATFTVGVGVEFTITVDFNYVFWHGPSFCMTAGTPPAVQDVWDSVEETNAVTCDTSSENNSARFVAGLGQPPPFPCANPAACYGGGVTSSEEPTERSFSGIGCLNDGAGGSTDYSGALFESLRDEDTEEDAIGRAILGQAWDGPGDCAVKTAFKTERGAGQFTFAFRKVQFRVIAGTTERPLTIGHTYRATVRIAQRPLGVGGPFVGGAIEEITFIADELIETGEWIDLLPTAGIEKKVVGCTLEDLDAP